MAIVTYILMIGGTVIGLGLILIFLKKLRKIEKKMNWKTKNKQLITKVHKNLEVKLWI